ncbi:MAG: hypothetical protein AAF702_22940 [Chloroflexota bacterium]
MTTTHIPSVESSIPSAGKSIVKQSSFLRRVVQVDAGVITLLGIELILAAQPVSEFMGVGQPSLYVILGILALLYDGGRFLWSLMGKTINKRLVRISLIANAVWAVASIPLLVGEFIPFSDAGWWAMAFLADWAVVFAVLQWIGLRRS